MSEEIPPLQQEKIRKLKELRARGVEPYPHKFREKSPISFLNEKFESLRVGEKSETLFHIAGRLMRKRDMGKTAFFNIQDESGDIQCYIRRDDFQNSKEPSSVKGEKPKQGGNKKPSAWELWKLFDVGDILGLSGHVFRTKKGELSLRIQNLEMLCKSIGALPEKYHGIEDKEIKYRYRHWDLIMDPEARKIFKTRSKIIYEIREFLTKKKFMEVETPILQPLYGGAMAYPFETYFRSLGQKMYLKISPEIYLKKLIVGGFEKIFEIGKNFRNEGIDRSHSPEFTMLEYYEAYTDYKDQMKNFEKLVCHVAKKIKGGLKFQYQGRELDLSPPWARINLKEFEDRISSIRDTKKPQSWADFWKEKGDKKPSPLSLSSAPERDQSICFKLRDYIRSIDPKAPLEDRMDQPSNWRDLREELALLALELTAEKYFWDPVFLTDFPLKTSPLTKKHRKDPLLVERFEPYIAGMEIGNAYTELNDPIDQRERLERQREKAPLKEVNKAPSHPVDENFLHAIETGMPPTAGVGLGIERLVMILTDQRNLRDSTLFPVLRDKKAP